MAVFVPLGEYVDGDDFWALDYTDYGLGMIMAIFGIPAFVILTFFFTRFFHKGICRLISN